MAFKTHFALNDNNNAFIFELNRQDLKGNAAAIVKD